MPLDARKTAHIAENRARIRRGRDETVVFVSVSGGVVGYQTVPGCVWVETGNVPAGVSNRIGEVTRAPYDALVEVPGETVFPTDLRLVARMTTATVAAVSGAGRHIVLDKRRARAGTPGSGGGENAKFLGEVLGIGHAHLEAEQVRSEPPGLARRSSPALSTARTSARAVGGRRGRAPSGRRGPPRRAAPAS
jgi:hypothetical protein